jgi:ABC-type amino acid transport substrate-binding protein
MAIESLLDQIRARGTVRITAHWGDTSAQYLDPDTGEPAGMVGLVGNLLARDLEVQPEFVDLPWADHIPALLDGRADVSVKHTNTPQRAFEVEFTVQSLLCEEGRIVIRRNRDLHSEVELNHPDRIIAVATGSSQEIHVRTRYPRAEVCILPTSQATFDAVAAGEVDACLHDTNVPGFLVQHPECTVLTEGDKNPVIPYRDCVHPCIRPGDSRFLNWLNSWMAFHKAGGTFESILAQAEAAHAAKLGRIVGQTSLSRRS